MTNATCPVCHLGPVAWPDEHGRHRDCAEQLNQPITRRCHRCQSWMTAPRETPAEDLLCSWCMRSDALAHAAQERAKLPPPPAPSRKRLGYTVERNNSSVVVHPEAS